MTIATVITEGFGSFGTIGLVVTSGYAQGDAVAPVVVTGGGGYVGYDHYNKRKKSVYEEREKLGVIPKAVKKVIKEVVKENLGYGSEEIANYELKQELERRDIAYKAQYAKALEQYRDHMVSLEIYRLMKIKQAADDQDDEDAAMWLLM